MIEGDINEHGVPVIPLHLADREWPAIVGTGFNGGLELPVALAEQVDAEFHGVVESQLATGIVASEEVFVVEVEFDGRREFVPATFTEIEQVLVGTRLLRHHRLEMSFPARTVLLEREPHF